MTWLLEPFGYVFMQRGLAAALLVGVLCSVVGCFVVLKSMAFMGDAVAHAILPGVAAAYILQINLTLGALITGILVAWGIGALSREGKLREDTAIGIIFTASLALGVAMINSMGNSAVDLSHILFGNVLGVSSHDLWLTLGITGIVITLMIVFFRRILVVTFDPILAQTFRLPVNAIRGLLLVLLSLTIVVSIQTVGVALSAALLVTPPATAYLMTRRLTHMMILSAVFGAVSSFSGLLISYYWNITSGSAIVLSATALFLVVFVGKSLSRQPVRVA